jgi:hypothetical protein
MSAEYHFRFLFATVFSQYDVVIDALEIAFPIIPHESTGPDCCGCIILVHVSERDAELACNASAVVGVVDVGILRDLVAIIRIAYYRPIFRR